MSTPIQKINALIATGKWAEASKRCTKYCQKIPGDPYLWQMAAAIEQQLGHPQKALAYYGRATELSPDSPNILLDYAKALLKAGNHEQASSVLHRVVTHAPDNAVAYQLLGWLHFTKGLLNEAKHYYELAIHHKPDMINAQLGLSDVWNALERRDDAASCLREAISISPNVHELHYSLGLLLDRMGQLDEAYEACNQTLKLCPNHLPAIALKADIHRRQGNPQKALELLDSLIKSGIKHPRIIEAYVNICQKVGRCNHAISLSQEVCTTTGIAEQDIMCLQFATGHALDRLGQFDEAFNQFHKANMHRNIRADVSGLQQLVDNIITHHTIDPAQTLQQQHNSNPKLVFIIGMPRSGTTLVEQILASHPDVYGAGELTAMHDIQNAFTRLTKISDPYPHGFSKLDENQANTLRQAYLSQLPDDSRGISVVTDKQPGNFLWVGLIRALFPDAAIIHCTRNPIDTCLSCYFNNFTGLPYTYDLTMLGKTWRVYHQLMQHWQTLSIPIMTSSYEALVDDVESASKALIAYCGLEWNDACLRFHENKRSISTVSLTQVNQPVYKKSVDRWKHYEKHLGPLTDALNGSN